jgi:hypothetical protein
MLDNTQTDTQLWSVHKDICAELHSGTYSGEIREQSAVVWYCNPVFCDHPDLTIMLALTYFGTWIICPNIGTKTAHNGIEVGAVIGAWLKAMTNYQCSQRTQQY